MRKLIIGAVFGAALFTAGATHAQSRAQADAEKLQACIEERTTEADKAALVPWLFAMMSSHPDVWEKAKFDDAERAKHGKTSATIVQRLVHQDCRAQVIAVLKTGEHGASTSILYESLARLAMYKYLTHRRVWDDFQLRMSPHIDQAKLEALSKEAGVE